MAQRHEIEAWVNPEAWDDPERAEQVIDAIEKTGSDDEAVWVQIVAEHDGLGEDDTAEVVLAAASRDADRAIAALDAAQDEPDLAAAAADLDRAQRAADDKLRRLHELIREKYRAWGRGSQARIAEQTGLSQQRVSQIVSGR